MLFLTMFTPSNRKKYFVLSASLLMSTMALPAQEGATLQQGLSFQNTPYSGTSDAMLVSGVNAGRNYGGTLSLWLGTGSGVDLAPRRSLIRFDLSALPVEHAITSGRLVLHCVQIKGAPEWAVYAVKGENASWVEGRNVIGKAELNTSSWSHRVNFYQEWTGGAGLGEPGGGYEEEPLYTSSASQHSARAGEPVEIELPAALLEAWRSGANAGLLLRVEKEENSEESYIRFGSADATQESHRPALEVRFAKP